jgi:hypothetical protein
MKKDQNSRVEQEIREILDRSDFDPDTRKEPTSARRYRPNRKKLQIGGSTGALSRVPSGIAWLIGIFGFAILAILVADWSRNLALVFAIASILVLFSPLVLWSKKAPLETGAKEWRGRVIQLPPSQTGPLGRIRYKIWELRNRSRY